MKSYSEAKNISAAEWLIVSSSSQNTEKQAVQFMTNFKPNQDGTAFCHSSYVALVNKRIRGFYTILISEETKRLKVDIKTLLK